MEAQQSLLILSEQAGLPFLTNTMQPLFGLLLCVVLQLHRQLVRWTSQGLPGTIGAAALQSTSFSAWVNSLVLTRMLLFGFQV